MSKNQILLDSYDLKLAKKINDPEITMLVGYGAKEEKVITLVERLHSIGSNLKDFFNHWKEVAGYTDYTELINLEFDCALYGYLYKKLTNLSKNLQYKLDLKSLITNFEEYTDSIFKLPLKMEKSGIYLNVKETEDMIIPDSPSKKREKKDIFKLIRNINKLNKMEVK
jgi:hypothetical protein